MSYPTDDGHKKVCPNRHRCHRCRGAVNLTLEELHLHNLLEMHHVCQSCTDACFMNEVELREHMQNYHPEEDEEGMVLEI
jgi:hypothetical protein